MLFWSLWCESRAILPKTFRPGYPRWNVPTGKFSYRLIGRKNQDLSYRASLVSQINTLKFFTKERAPRRNFENRAHMKRPTMNPPSRPGGVHCSNGLYQYMVVCKKWTTEKLIMIFPFHIWALLHSTFLFASSNSWKTSILLSLLLLPNLTPFSPITTTNHLCS